MRLFVSAIILLAGFAWMNARGKGYVSFDSSDDPAAISLLYALDACQVKATIKGGEPETKFFELWLVKNNLGQLSRELYGFIPAKADSTDIVFTSVVADSLTAYLSTFPTVCRRRTMNLPTANCLLIECVNEEGYALGDTIPLVTFSSGKRTRINLGNGAMTEGFDVCGVRYSGIHPSLWNSEFGIGEFYYVEAVPVKEIDYNKLFTKDN